METEFVSLEIEATGTDPLKDRIIKIDAVEFIDGVPRQKYYSLARPSGTNAPKDAPFTSVILNEFLKFAGARTLVAHYADFDMSFINAESKRQGIDLIANTVESTFKLAKKNLNLTKYELKDVARKLNLNLAVSRPQKIGYIYLALQNYTIDSAE
jgi:DNA polymerase-3 subunit alpha (Gram-positive type)